MGRSYIVDTFAVIQFSPLARPLPAGAGGSPNHAAWRIIDPALRGWRMVLRFRWFVSACPAALRRARHLPMLPHSPVPRYLQSFAAGFPSVTKPDSARRPPDTIVSSD
jgi:hypothetical protein